MRPAVADWGVQPQSWDLDRASGARFGIEGFTPFGHRDLSDAVNVDVYRNLNEQRRWGRVRWSIRDSDSGLVLGHADKLAVSSAWAHVGAAAQARIAAGGPRSVHAWVSGQLTFCPTDGSPWYQTSRRVDYDPRRCDRFEFVDSGDRFGWAATARFDEHGMWVRPTGYDRCDCA